MPLHEDQLVKISKKNNIQETTSILKSILETVKNNDTLQIISDSIASLEKSISSLEVNVDNTDIKMVLQQLSVKLESNKSENKEYLFKELKDLLNDISEENKAIRGNFKQLTLDLSQIKEHLRKAEKAKWKFDILRDDEDMIKQVNVERIQ